MRQGNEDDCSLLGPYLSFSSNGNKYGNEVLKCFSKEPFRNNAADGT